MLHISVLVINRLNGTESGIFVSLEYSLLPKALMFVELICKVQLII